MKIQRSYKTGFGFVFLYLSLRTSDFLKKIRVLSKPERLFSVIFSGMITFKATKGSWWMPWHQEAMKDVISCDKPRVEAHILLSGDFRMGKPTSNGGMHQ